MISKEEKLEIIKKFGGSDENSGKTEVQIGILTARINDLTGHAERHRKDNHNRRGLINLVSKRRKLLDYLMRKDIGRYRQILVDLSLRK